MSVAELQSEGPIGEGSRFLTVYRGVENESTIQEFDRPERLVVATTSDRLDIDTTYTFTEANGGTTLVVRTDVRPKGFASILSPVLGLFMRREVAKKYAAVKQACEGRANSSSG